VKDHRETLRRLETATREANDLIANTRLLIQQTSGRIDPPAKSVAKRPRKRRKPTRT
jgi:hypothetical protein